MRGQIGLGSQCSGARAAHTGVPLLQSGIDGVRLMRLAASRAHHCFAQRRVVELLSPQMFLSRGIGYVALALLAVAMTGCGSSDEKPDEPPAFDVGPGYPYEVLIKDAPDAAFEELLKSALRLYTLAERPVASLSRLRHRIEEDLDFVERALRSEGYLQGAVSYEIVPPEKNKPPPASLDSETSTLLRPHYRRTLSHLWLTRPWARRPGALTLSGAAHARSHIRFECLLCGWRDGHSKKAGCVPGSTGRPGCRGTRASVTMLGCGSCCGSVLQ